MPRFERIARPAAAKLAEQEAAARLAAARARAPVPHEHRAVRRARITAAQLAGALLSAAAAVALLHALQPVVDSAWREQLLFWSGHLQTHVALGPAGGIELLGGAGAMHAAGLPEILAVSSATLLVWASSLLLPDPMTPVSYFLRILCVVQWSAVAFYVFAGDRFPYTLAWHLDAMLACGRASMLAAAILMPLSEGLLGVPLHVRAAHLLLVLAYFTLLVPHGLLMHAWLLEHGSILLMPLLYLAFGTLLHVLVFVALLSWMLSGAAALDGAPRSSSPAPEAR